MRLAARTNAVICPFGAVGADDAFDLFMDTDEILAHPVLGPIVETLLKRLSGEETNLQEAVMPITKIPGTDLPSPVPISNLVRPIAQAAVALLGHFEFVQVSEAA